MLFIMYFFFLFPLISLSFFFFFFFFNDTATTEIYTLSLHDALPIFQRQAEMGVSARWGYPMAHLRSEEHTSELQSRPHLVCRLLLEKKKKTTINSEIVIKKKEKGKD